MALLAVRAALPSLQGARSDHQGTPSAFEDGDAALEEPLLSPLGAVPDACQPAADRSLPLPLPTAWQCCPGGPQQPGHWQHPPAASYARHYMSMAAWLAALYAGYAVQRAGCQIGLPQDGLRQIDAYELFSDVTSIALWGIVLGWLVGVTCPRRFAWLFSRRRWYLWATMLGTPPVYSAISNVSTLKHDLVHFDTWGLPFILLWSAGMAAILGTVAWHLLRVAKTRAWPDAAAYAASRLLFFAFFAGSAAALRLRGVDMHLHHLYLGWSLALWAELNHPLSGVTLAIGCGIFLQGIGAYSFAPVFQDGCFSTPSAPAFQCSFWADSPFSVRICAAGGQGLPSHSCS